jgi:hypothetical protein
MHVTDEWEAAKNAKPAKQDEKPAQHDEKDVSTQE